MHVARFAQAARGDGLVARALQQLLVDELRLRLVLDDEHRHAATDRPPPPAVTARSGEALRSSKCSGSVARERGADAELAAARRLRRSSAARAGGTAAGRGRCPSRAPAADSRTCVNSSKMRAWSSGADADARVRDGEHDACARPRVGAAVTRTSPRSVNLMAFEMKLRRICETLPSSLYMTSDCGRLVEHELHVVAHQQRAQHAAQRAEQVRHGELHRAHFGLARFDLREVEQIVHQLGEIVGGLGDEAAPACPARRSASPSERSSSSRDSARIEFSGVRNSWLMFERNLRLHVVRAAQVVRLLVELRVQRDDAAVRVFELAVEMHAARPAARAARTARAAAPGSAAAAPRSGRRAACSSAPARCGRRSPVVTQRRARRQDLAQA